MAKIIGWKPGDPIPEDIPEVEYTPEELAAIDALVEKYKGKIDPSLDLVDGADDDFDDLPEYDPDAPEGTVVAFGIQRPRKPGHAARA